MTTSDTYSLAIHESLEWLWQEEGCPSENRVDLVISKSRQYYDEISPAVVELCLVSATVGDWQLPVHVATRLWEQVEETFAGVV